jgi:hypothetical protein
MKFLKSISPFLYRNYGKNSDYTKVLTSVICVVSCIPAAASWHDSDTVRKPPAAVAAVAVAAAAVVAETVACTAPLSAPC